MAVLMVFDHIGHIPNLISVETASVLHVLTRCVGVWFAYMAVEGFFYTRSRTRYTLRLFMWAAVMWAGNSVYNLIAARKGLAISNNIFFTLGLGVLCLNVLAHPRWHRAVRYLLAGLVTIFAVVFSEGGIVLLPFMMITYAFRGRKRARNLSYLLLSAFLFLICFQFYPSLHTTLVMLGFSSDFLFITVLPFLALYNGERGPNGKFSKYFFYVFYPLHLWVIGAAALLAP